MNKRPIVIVASARSGSTAYCYYLGKLHSMAVWAEPSYDEECFESFKQYISSGNNYVLKIISYQIANNQVYNSIIESDCYKIKLTRSNKIEQVASHYIGQCTNIWNSHNEYARGKQYSVPIDIELINSIIQVIIDNDKVFDSLGINFDEEQTYEELIKTIDLNSTIIAKIIPPVNYDLLKTVIEEEYDKYR